jgi:hypothetical protein
MLALAEEGQILPAHCEVELSRTNERDTIEIELFQQDDQIGTVVIRDVPKDAPIGSKVTLSIDVTPNNRLFGHASVYSRQGDIAVEAPVDVRIPPIKVDDILELKRRYARASQKWEEFPEIANALADRNTIEKVEATKLKIDRLFKATNPDPQEILILVRALEKTLNPPQRIDMDPPKEVFDTLVRHLEDILLNNETGGLIDDERKIFQQLKKQALEAYSRGDKRIWYKSNSTLRNLLYKLTRPLEGDQYFQRLPPTPVMKAMVGDQINRVVLKLDAKQLELEQLNRLDRNSKIEIGQLRGELERAQTELRQISDNLSPNEAYSRVDVILLQKVRPIENRIPFIGGPDVSAREFE